MNSNLAQSIMSIDGDEEFNSCISASFKVNDEIDEQKSAFDRMSIVQREGLVPNSHQSLMKMRKIPGGEGFKFIM